MNDLITPVVTKINVDIGHAYALGIEKTLKKQIKTQGVYVGDPKEICHHAPRPGATPGTHGDPLGFCKIDVILHDKKIIGIPHFFNDRKLVLHTLTVGRGIVCALRDLPGLKPCGKAPFGKLTQIRHGACPLGTREFWQVALCKIKGKLTPLGNFCRVLDRPLKGAKKHFHLGGIFIIEFISFKADGTPVIKAAVGLNTHEHRLHFRMGAREIVTVVCCYKRQRAGLSNLDKHWKDLLLLGQAVILYFNIKIIFSKNGGVFACRFASALKIPREQKLRDPPRQAPGKRDQPLGMLTQKLNIDTWLCVKPFGKAARNKVDEIAVSHLVFAKEHEMVGVCIERALSKSGARCHIDLTADDGLYPLGNASLIKSYCTVHHAVVGKRNRIVPASLGALGDIRHATRAVKQAIFTV